MWRDAPAPPRASRPTRKARKTAPPASGERPRSEAGTLDCVEELRRLGGEWKARSRALGDRDAEELREALDAASDAPSGRAGMLARLNAEVVRRRSARRAAVRARSERMHEHELARFVQRTASGSSMRTHDRAENALTRRRLPYDDRVSRARERPLSVVALEEYGLRWWGRCPEHRVVEDDACAHCGGGMELVEPYGLEACLKCGRMRRRADSTVASVSASATQAPTVDWRVFCYSRAHYAEHLLRQLQARGNATVPEWVVDSVRAELERAKNASKKPEGPSAVRDVEAAMRRLTRARRAKGEPTMQPWYEAAPLIHAKLSGLPPFRLTRAMERAMLNRFREASACFDRLARQDDTYQRKNMANYSFCLRRVADHLSDEFPEMRRFITEVLAHEGRDRSKVNAQLWSRICEQLGWRDNSTMK